MLPVVATGLAAIWSLVPVGVWLAGADPRYYAQAWQGWLWGTLVAALVSVLGLLVTRGRVALLLLDWWRALAARPRAGRFVAAVAVLLAVLAVLTCLLVFSGNPRNVDGFAELFQARIFLAGRLWVPPPPPAELANFATLHVIIGPARWFSQYPPGQSVVLAGGLALGAWWLLNPLFAAALVAATWRVARWCAGETEARLAALLLCVSPFVVAVAGSEMSHLPAAALGMLAAAAAVAAGGKATVRPAALAGVALAAMATFRPLDAVAAAVPVALILLLAPPSPRRRVAAFGAVIASGALCSLPLLLYNAGTTGSWREFGYNYLWGPGHSLGFHPVPWGIPLTPARAVGLTGLDLHQLNLYLFDAPFPILVLVALGYAVARRRLVLRDAVPLAGAFSLVALLFFWWHRDVFYGPRFLFSAVPWFVVLVARAVTLLRRSGRELFPGVGAGLAAVFAVAILFALGLATITPVRVSAYRRATPDFDLHPDRDARRAGISHAVIVIPDGWGSRLIARMWALGVAPRLSTRLYGAIDACTLEQALDSAALDRSDRARAHLLATLDSLAAQRRPGVPAGVTSDPNLRLLRGVPLAAACRTEIAFDSAGFLAFAPFLYLNRPSLDGDIVWARDLGRWNTALFERYWDRKLYRYAPGQPGGPPVFAPIARQTGPGAVE